MNSLLVLLLQQLQLLIQSQVSLLFLLVVSTTLGLRGLLLLLTLRVLNLLQILVERVDVVKHFQKNRGVQVLLGNVLKLLGVLLVNVLRID